MYQDDVLNRTIDEIKVSIDGVSDVRREGNYQMSDRYKNSHNFSKSKSEYRHDYRANDYRNSEKFDLKKRRTVPKAVTFHGSVIYDSIYL